ncbi:dihydrolipoyl dehydrogenase [Planctomycetota bacterium]
MTKKYDVAVIGSGPGGYVAALRAALRGAKTCCIEKGILGGTCLNVGCIPTKAMLHASEIFWQFGKLKQFGISIENPQIDTRELMKRTTRVVSGLRKGVEFLLKKRNVDVIAGHGKLIGKNTIEVSGQNGTQTIQAQSIIIATGSRPPRPDYLPWDSGRVITTDEACTNEQMPQSILIRGGGVIGCEFATMYSELGIPTTVVKKYQTIASGIDHDIEKQVFSSLKRKKVNLIFGTSVVSATAGENSITAQLENGREIEVDKILLCSGRSLNIENLGLEELGIETEDGHIKVDDRCQTNVEGIYAIGDVAEYQQLAHLASRMGIVAADNAAGHPVRDDRSVVPSGIYTHPEAAMVGLNEEQAREKCPDLKVSRFPYSASGMAQAYGEPQGMIKIMADEKSGLIIGGVVIGPHATDIIQEITVAMRNKLTVEQIADTIHPHPTFIEAVAEAAEAWMGLPLHIL